VLKYGLFLIRFFQCLESGALPPMLEAVALAVHIQDMHIMSETVQHRAGEPFTGRPASDPMKPGVFPAFWQAASISQKCINYIVIVFTILTG